MTFPTNNWFITTSLRVGERRGSVSGVAFARWKAQEVTMFCPHRRPAAMEEGNWPEKEKYQKSILYNNIKIIAQKIDIFYRKGG
jgi:hypothetical protein